jgi:PKD repeat protein
MTDLQVNYTDISGADNLLWDFGDGDTSTLTNPVHVYPASGNYPVCLIATDQCGADTLCGIINVSCPLPNAGFTWVASDLTTSFTNTTVGGSPSWDFGDGTPFNTQFSPIHTFDFPGDYAVCLTISDSCGSSQICDTINVSCPIPSAGFSFVVGSGGLVTFTNTTNPLPDNYFWDFGDGLNSTAQNPTHTYTSSNNYNACLIITDTCGLDTFCTSINVVVDASIEGELAGLVNVYPNPADDYFFVSISGFGSDEIQLTLTNALGQSVWSKSKLVGDILLEIPAVDLADGVYLLKIESGMRSKWIKLLKQ